MFNHGVKLQGVWLIEAETSKHKTSTTKQMQTELLPFTALGRAFNIKAWVEPWMAARESEGLNAGPPFRQRPHPGCVSCWLLHQALRGQLNSLSMV